MPSLYRPQRNWGTRIHETMVAGIPATVLENRHLRITLLQGKGTDVVEFNYKPLDLDFVWLAPGGVRNPSDFHATATDPLGAFHDSYAGGWQEIFPNGGHASSWAGASYGQHAEVFALPWDMDVLEDGEQAIAVRLRVGGVKTPCVIEKTIRMDAATARIEITEELVNTGPVPFAGMWGHHITFGRPFLSERCRITMPPGVRVMPDRAFNTGSGQRRIRDNGSFPWPMATGADGGPLDLSRVPEAGGPGDMLYLTGFPDPAARYRIDNPERGVGMEVTWDRETMPHLWMWQELGASQDYPFYGRAYVIGLEPFSSTPKSGLPAAIENATALVIPPHGRRSFSMTAAIVTV